MTLLTVGGLGEDIQCTHVQYRIMHTCAYYNCDYFVGLIFVVSKKRTPQNFHAIRDGGLFITVVVVAMRMLRYWHLSDL